MEKRQFRVLFRQFLFRMVDLEVLSSHAQGDITKLLGQFAALLIFISLISSLPAIFGWITVLPPVEQVMYAWSSEYFLIATTMLVVGLFAVLSWDSTFPNRRDVLVLAPLPVRARTLFAAKVAGVGMALSLTIAALHVFCGLFWPLSLSMGSPAITLPVLRYDGAMPPVAAAGMKKVLDQDLGPVYQTGTGELAPGLGTGLAVGVWQRGTRQVFSYGTAKPDSVFEIGGLSQTFTGLILARMAAQGKLSLDKPVRDMLPPDMLRKPRGREMTLLDLATHHADLPRMPNNFPRGKNAYANYHRAQLYEYMAWRGVSRLSDAGFSYSDLGFGLLGQLLADQDAQTYPEILRQYVTEPLGLRDTVVQLSADQRQRFLTGHFPPGTAVDAWDMDALAGAGGIRSTVGDVLTFLERNLHPAGMSGVAESQELKGDAEPGRRLTLAWMYDAGSGTYWHNGSTQGFSSYAFFRPQDDTAGVVLLNTGAWPPLCDMVGEHIRQRLTGEPAVSLAFLKMPGLGGWWGLLRLYAVYWIAMLASGAFIFYCVLGLQGVAAECMPRRWFLRASSFLQLAVFCVLLSAYFLLPGATPGALMSAQSGGWLGWAPPFWFLGLFQQLNGSPGLAPLAARAWIALAIAVCATAIAYGLSYVRTLRRIVEEPDIVPGSGRTHWLPRFGNSLETALVQFSLRSLLRSRQHRVILAFYVGIGFAVTILFLKSPVAQEQFGSAATGEPWRYVSVPMLASSIVMLGFWIAGTRVIFSLPMDLRANWVFRVTPVRGGLHSLAARRRAMLMLGVAPPWIVLAVLLLAVWPWREALAHLAVLLLLGVIAAEVSVHGAQKLPFTCSYLPGKSSLHMRFWLFIGLIVQVIDGGAQLEIRALRDGREYTLITAGLLVAALVVRWWNVSAAKSEEKELRFEEAPVPAIFALEIHKDGVVPL